MMNTLYKLTLAGIFASAIFSVIASAQIANCGKEDYACQIEEYTKQITANPNNVEAYYNRGRAYESSGSYDKAIPDLTRYISSNISNREYLSDGYTERGLCYKNS